MITGELKNKVDRAWDSFWSGGISNPLEVIEQITYLLFLRRLDDLQILAENKARATGGPIEDPKFLPGQEHLRWSRFKNMDADVMYKTAVRAAMVALGQVLDMAVHDDILRTNPARGVKRPRITERKGTDLEH